MSPISRAFRAPLLAPFIRWATRLRFPWLLGLTVVLLLINLVVPDPIPFVDEILLALVAAVLGSLRKRPSRDARRAGRN
jgi:hypothetical protein